MAGEFTMKLDGDKSLIKAIRTLEFKAQKTVLRKATAASAAPIRKAMKKNAPVETGTLKKSIRTKTKTYKNGTVVAITGARDNTQTVNGKPRNPGKYAHLVEFGTAPHTIRSVVIDGKFFPVVKHPGSPAKPFMRQAWQSQNRPALTKFGEKAWTEISNEAKKARAKKG